MWSLEIISQRAFGEIWKMKLERYFGAISGAGLES